MPKYDLNIDPPVMNAAGSLGFVPDRRSGRAWDRFGAFVTNPISLAPRTPAGGTRFFPFPGGFLLHTGYPNPGLRACLRRYGSVWDRSLLPVIVHLLAQEPDEVAWMVPRLEGREGIMGLEIGLPPDVDPPLARSLVEAALGEFPLIVRLPFEQAFDLALVVMEAGAAMVSLGAARGEMVTADGKLVAGRIYGPAVLPRTLYLTRRIAALGIPIVAAGGIYSDGDTKALLDSGAAGVQLDTWLWSDLLVGCDVSSDEHDIDT